LRTPLPRDAFAKLIETARLRLRKPERREEALYARLAAEAYATRTKPLSEEQARALAAFMIEHWDRYRFGFFVIDVIANSKKLVAIGHAGVKCVDAWPNQWAESYEAIELGYFVVPSGRGHGYVTEAARAVLAAAFEAFDVASVSAWCSLDNPKSAAVLLRCGMTELEETDTRRRFEITRPVHAAER
jgi:RimJ/RimL family protein N-acetyltransferase